MSITSIKNKMILCFLLLILVVLLVVTTVNLLTNKFYLAQAVSTAIALGAGIFFGGIFSNSLVTRLNSLSSEAQIISSGDLTRDIEVVSMDEVRSLEEIFALMVQHIRSMIADIKKISSQIKVVNTILMQLARRVLQSSQEIGRSATEIAKGSETQALIVQKTALQVENNVKSMDGLVRCSSQTMSKINQAMLSTQTGEQDARETLMRLETVLKEMGRYVEPVTRLTHKVEKIKMIVSVMDDIAQKTDLLSLNASIEATRAGESSKGFALVAEEIRTMADGSKQSSHEISKLVADILQDSRAVTGLLEKNQSEINTGHEIINGIVGIFAAMLTSVKAIFSEVKQMEAVSTEQMDRMRGLTENFSELARLANDNFLATQKTSVAINNQERDVSRIAKAVKGLNSLSRKMTATQKQFKLPEDTA